MDYLVFRLYGPLASWGEIAVGESRHTAPYPTKSALLGLLGAALGIRREEDVKQTALANSCRFAVKVLASGSLLRDYHTTQVPDSAGKRQYRTRRDELVVGADRLGTVLSSREYRCDGKMLIAVHADDCAPYTLSELKAVLLAPKYQLSLGRKACVLAAPLAPEVISASSLKEVFEQYPHAQIMPTDWLEDRWLGEESATFYWEGELSDLTGDSELEGAQRLTRHDMPISRVRWQFKPRQEWVWREAAL